MSKKRTFEVWHNETRGQRFFSDIVWTRKNFPSGFVHVADIELEDKGMASLNEAYSLTNSITRNWFENAGVSKKTALKQVRSTSVGDVLIDKNTGAAFMCDSTGWTKV